MRLYRFDADAGRPIADFGSVGLASFIPRRIVVHCLTRLNAAVATRSDF